MVYNPEDFTVVGYDIRKKWKYVDKEIRVSLENEFRRKFDNCYTIDTYLRERHESIIESEWDKIESLKSLEGLYYYYKDILELYNQFDERTKTQYEIIGYSVENERIDVIPREIEKENSSAKEGYFDYVKKRQLIISEEFCPIGFDVVTSMYMWISAITNCGLFNKKEGREFLEKLNSYNLFGSYEEAIDFRNFSDENIPEHAPFVVWQIYRSKYWKKGAEGSRPRKQN